MKRRIINSLISQGSLQEQAPVLLEMAKTHTPGYACMVNVHMLIEAQNSKSFREVVNSATIAFPDGMPVAKMFRLRYGVSQERIAGMDFFPYFMGVCSEHKLKVALLGSTPEVLEKIEAKAAIDYPGVKISCSISPPFGQAWDNEAYIEQINATGTHVVFVALGCPRQEKWMFQYSERINAVLFGVGGAFPVYAGTIGRAPKWMQDSGLEWLHRLVKEPRRMFKRYFYTNTYFLILAIGQLITRAK
jgi:N-acetylglucosaminyldiphosphoundecaprenol N-acetyl-beta-D-mannosaminyltransferase